MNLADITPLVITYNEEANIARTLAALSWARRIVVVDSGSTDQTLEILRGVANVEVLARAFDNFASQCSFGLRHIQSEYTLSLDADHVVTPQLMEEIASLEPQGVEGWLVPFSYCIDGVPLRASLFPPRIALFRTSQGSYENDGHAHRVAVRGAAGRMRSPLLHDDRKPLQRWLSSQMRYAEEEGDKISVAAWTSLRWPDRCRRLYVAPLLVLPYCLLVKGLILDGKRGLFYSLQRLYAEVLLMLVLVDKARR